MTTPDPFITHLPSGGVWVSLPPNPANHNPAGRYGWTPRGIPPLAPEHDHHDHLDYQLPSLSERRAINSRHRDN